MFRIEEIQNPIADNFKSKGGSRLISVFPLDTIPVNIPKTWTFKPTTMPEYYKNRAKDFANFEVREDDIWIVTYPKCGTTWTQEMAWMLVNGLNFNKAKSIDITERSIFFEIEGIVPGDIWTNFELLNKQKSPRVIKTHLPMGLLPRDIWRKNCKIIYTARDPKDAIISFYYFYYGTTHYNGALEEMVEQVLTNNMTFCSFWHHVLEFWLIRDQQNILFITYEDMKKDLREIIEKTCKFLKKDYTQEQILLLMEHLSFDSMKGNSTCNNQGLVRTLYAVNKLEYDEKTSFQFMRKGQVGGHKTVLARSYIERINAKTKEIFEPHGLHLYCDDT